MKKLNVEIIIPVYNEAWNIKQLLISLIQQEEIDFVITQIKVISDASTDTTQQQVHQIHDKRIVFVNGKTRLGKSKRLNEAYSDAKADVLVQYDGDVVIPHSKITYELIKPFLKNKSTDIVFGRQYPTPPTSLPEKAAYFGFYVWEDAKNKLKDKANRYRVHGQIRAFSKKFYQVYRIPDKNSIAEDTYNFYFAMKHQARCYFSKSAYVYFRLPNTVTDYVNQMARYLSIPSNLENHFDCKFMNTYNHMKKKLILQSFVSRVLKTNPVTVIFYLCIHSLAKIKAIRKSKDGIWKISTSTKQINNKSTAKTKVLVYPKDVNPYQNLLYQNMNEDIEIAYFQNIPKPRILNMLITPIELAYFRLKGYKIMHLHWFFSFCFSNTNPILMKLSELYLNIFLYSLKIFGYKLVWTVHDLLPHEPIFTNDLEISKKIAYIADSLIVPNSTTRSELINDLDVLPTKIQLIPLGNFIGFYPTASKTTTKNAGLNFLFFGQIKPYKGLDLLIESFKKFPDKSARLNIVGPCNDHSYLKILGSMIGNDLRITLTSNFIPNHLVGEFFAKTDVVVLPFKEITNTSSAVLAFSMKKPVIAPLLGMIKDFPRDTGFYYDPKSTTGLKKALSETKSNIDKLPKMSDKAFKYAKKLDWRTISQQTSEVYHKMIYST